MLVAGCLVLGVGLASAGPPWLTVAERIVIGMVIAIVALTALGYGLSLLIGLTAVLVLVLAIAALGVGAYLLVRHVARIPEFVPRQWSLPLAVVVIAIAMAYLFGRAVEITPQAWLAHYNNTWSDWASHASYATSFVFGHNLPPQNPIFAGTPFRYPFAADFVSALLIAGGWSIPNALAWPSWALTVLVLSGLILWGRRLTGGIGAGLIAVTLTLLGGGLGFWFFFGDARQLGLINALTHLPKGYDRFDPPVNIQWYNPILSWYLPQRSFVFGAAIVIAVLLLITAPLMATPLMGWRTATQAIAAGWRRWSMKSEAVAFIVAGALAGSLPFVHLHALVALGLVTLCLALLYPRPAWIGFFVAMAILAVPRLLFAVPGDAGLSPEHQYPQLMAGWMSHYGAPTAGYDFPPWFWIKNTGLFWPLLLLALLSSLALRGQARLLIAAFSLVFVVANIVKFQPWDWDNSKLLVFWYMGSAVAVGAMLLRLWRVAIAGPALAAVAWLTLIASGVLSLLQFLPPQGPAYLWFSAEDLQLAAEVRQLTPPTSIFVTGADPANEIAAYPTNPVADLAGRSVLMSYPGWLWSYGINYAQREADIFRIYQGGPTALDLLHHYHADYVVVGPSEMATIHPNVDYFNTTFRLAIHTEHYFVYAVPR